MREDGQQPAVATGQEIETVAADDGVTSRRTMLRFAALGGAAIVTVRPGIAQAATSALKCTITVPNESGMYLSTRDGSVVAKGTKNSIAGPASPLKAEDIRTSMNNYSNYSGATTQQTNTWNMYIKNLSQGKQGYTCYCSIQNPMG